MKISYVVKGKKDEFLSALAPYVAKFRFFRYTEKGKSFYGTIEQDGFKITRALGKFERNSFVPVVVGKFGEKDGELVLDVKFRLHFVIGVFTMLFLGFAAFVFLDGIFTKEFFRALVGAFLFLGYFAMMKFFFNKEIRRAREILDEIFIQKA